MRRDLIALSDHSKVWVYQCDQFINDEDSEAIKQSLYEFTMQWSSHGQELECYAQLFHNKFLVFVADDAHIVSGCSIDSSVNFIKTLESKFNLNFFDRLNFTYMKDDEVKVIHSSQFKAAFDSGQINADTFMFDNLVKDKAQFLSSWIVPLKESWYTKFIS